MRRLPFGSIRSPWVLASLVLWFGTQAALAAEPQVRLRGLATKYFADGEGTDLAQLLGWSDPVKNVIALEYKILLYEDGEEKTVDPKTYVFQVGDRIRLAVEPFADSYIYIFHVGPDGKQSFLLPREQDQPARVKAHENVSLPTAGYFEFVEPAGKEKLMVVATEAPIADRLVLAGTLTKSPEEYSPEEKEVSEELITTVEANIQSVEERMHDLKKNMVRRRGLPGTPQWDEIVQDVRTRNPKRGTFEEPPRQEGEGTVALYASIVDQEEGHRVCGLVVIIPLGSHGSTAVRP